MKWIGLTGGIGSGKSTVAELLRARGFVVVDADQVAHDVVQKGTPGLQAVLAAFGPEYLREDGELDRARLGKWVFGRPQELRKLEALLHPLIQNEVQRQKAAVAQTGAAFAFYDVPLLYEKKLEPHFDAVVVVWSEEHQQLSRAVGRGAHDEPEVRRRMSAQKPLHEKRGLAHFVVDNSGSAEALTQEVDDLIARLQALVDSEP